MTLPAAAQAFWSHWPEGAPYGEPRPPSYHHGQDVPCAAHAPVYALRSGHVAARGYSTALGYYFVIQHGPNDYDGYCHQLSTPEVGWPITAGEHVSTAAGPADKHGSQWTGPHLHFTNGPQAQSVLGLDNCRDPRPIIRAALAPSTGPAGGGVAPITNPQPKQKVREMVIIQNTNQAPVAYRFAAMGELSFDVLRNPNVPDASKREQRAWGGPPLPVDQLEFDQFLAQVNQRRAGAQPAADRVAFEVSDAITVAIITTLGLVIAAIVGAVPVLVRISSRTTATLHQVQNSHRTNLRDELDERHQENSGRIGALETGLKQTNKSIVRIEDHLGIEHTQPAPPPSRRKK